MSVPQRGHGIRILKAVSSPIRLQTLNLLFDKGPLSYTELMSSLKMNPSRDAGRFAYHLKFLLKADLIEADVEARKYCLTDLGKMVIDVADRIDKKISKPKEMLVRTSRFALEEFDANKIANSLVKEAKMPVELAQRVAKEAEKQLLKSKTKYLTAPLVREIVNAILIEKGLEEYRHKLTRLGVPVHDVTRLIESMKSPSTKSVSVREAAGAKVFREFMLLNIFPRDIADAHLSGSLHINDLSSWILKPAEVVHDTRFFIRNGLDLETIRTFQSSFPPPQNLESALFLVFGFLLHSAREIDVAQTIAYFNIFLAPFARGVESSRIKEALRLFTASISQHVDVSFGLELTVPDFIGNKPAFGLSGKPAGNYKDFIEESQLLASLFLEILSEETAQKPLFNPRLILEIRPSTFVDERAKTILLKAHLLAAERGVPYFANALGENQKQSVFSFSGCRLDSDMSGDWEIDTLRTGCLGVVTVNLPRIAYESGKDQAKFSQIMKERLEMAARALEIKYRMLKQHDKGLLPFLTSSSNGDQYLRLENCSRMVILAGLRETVEAFSGKNIIDEKMLAFPQEMTNDIAAFARKIGDKRGRRLRLALLPSFEASERLAQLDIEKYGIGKVHFSGSRERPLYSTIRKLKIQDGKVSQEQLMTEHGMRDAFAGGELTVIELGDEIYKPEELLAVTKQLAESNGATFFTYDRKLTYCTSCRRSWSGLLHKCPSCGAVDPLRFFDRFAGA